MPESVVRLRSFELEENGNFTTSFRGNVLGGDFSRRFDIEAEVDRTSFQVHTVPEISEIRREAHERIDGIVNTGGAIDQSIQAAETRLREEVIQSIDRLPQRLLSEEAIRVIREAILVELRQEIDALRRDLQAQIDEVRQRV